MRQEVQGIRAFKRLFGDMAGRQRRRMAVAVLLRCAEEGHRIKLEQQTADQLGGGSCCQHLIGSLTAGLNTFLNHQ